MSVQVEEIPMPAEETQVVKPIVNATRLYVNNVSYLTTENDIIELLKDFEVVSVLVPSHTVRGLKSFKQKSLGIAYIDFLTEEQANLAKEKLNAEKLCGRQLKAKSFIPYSPNVRRSGSNTRADENTPMSSIDAVEEEEKKNIEESSPSSKIDNFAEVGETTPTRPVSDVTVYIGRLPSKVTDGDLREYFHEYVPTEVYIFKSRNMRSHKPFFRHGVVSALVTLSSENGLSRALEQLKDVKLKGRVLHLKAAYISKVEEVKRAAEARQKKLEESTSGMHAAEENAVPEEGTVVEGEPTI